MRSRLSILLMIVALPVAPQGISWKTEIDNNLVQVDRRVVAPRETVSIAEVPPALLIFLTDYSVRLTAAQGRDDLRGKPGEFRWLPGGRIGLENLSGDRVEVARVTPKFSAPSAEALGVPGRGKVLFDNDLIRVRPIRFGRDGKAVHGPGPPSVVIQLSAAHIKFTQAGGRVEEFRMKAGDIRFESGGAFSAENLGNSLEALRIQLKAKP